MPLQRSLVVTAIQSQDPQALREILGSLPARFPLPVVCVQHIGSSFLGEMVMWLAEICPLPVRKATHGEAPQGRTVYFAPEDVHLELDAGGGRFALSQAAPVDGHQPSVTVTMRAAARCFGAGTVGVLLTGMGRDGAEELRQLREKGAVTFAQDKDSSVVHGMPGEAIRLDAATFILTPGKIAAVLTDLARNKNNNKE